MASSFEQFQKRRLISSYFSVILIIFIVLTLLGALGLFVINTEKLSGYVKENIPLTIYFKREAKDENIKAFGKELETADYIKNFHYVSKKEAAEKNKDILGDFESLIENPLFDSYDIHLKSAYVQPDSIKKIDEKFRKNEMVADVSYDAVVVEMANENIKKITFWILVISGGLTFVAMLLINSSLRLSIYSHRFTIKTMQMVGATKSFIRRPFVWRGIKLGLIGALLAIGALLWMVNYVDSKLPFLDIWKDWVPTAIVMGGVLGFGIIIAAISTFFATQRFLNLRTDDLY